MAETSRSQVTITLGRSGQVVKRAGAVLDREFSDPVPAVGSKRSVRDRLGGSVDAVQLDNKRLRGDNGRLNFNPSSSIDDFHLSKDDLRFKIMKRTQTNGHQNTVDLRDMLSRRARSSTTNPNNITSPRHTTQTQSQTQSQRVPETRDDRRPRMPDPRDNLVNLQRMPPRNDDMLDPRDKRQHMSHPQDERQQRVTPKMNNNEMTGGQHRTSEGSSSHMGILGNSYSPSPWTLDHIRRKSPPRRIEEPQRRMVTREYENINPRIENPRTLTYGSRDVNVSEVSRPPMGMSMSTTSFLPKPSLSVVPTKPLGPPSLPPGGNMQRSPYPVEHVTVEGFLRSLGLEKYLISFKVEEVDMAALSQMGDHDLKELGIPMGPRKKILLALIARNRRQAR